MIRYTKRRRKSLFFIFIIILIIIFGLIKIFKTKKESTDITKNNIVQENIITNNNNETKSNTIYNENVEVVNIQEENIQTENIQVEDSQNEEDETEKNEISSDVHFGSDVAFIGNSRTQAFLMYTGLTEVTDYTNIGLMVDTAITKKLITNKNGEKITILEDLKNININTIYIMLGTNELGWVYSSIFIQKYEELIDKILEIKPNCKIKVQSIIPVTKSKSDNDSVYNNQKITEYNKLIKDMADRKNIEFINLVPILSDENGNLPEDASPDGVHLNKEYCMKWLEYLKNN